MPKHLFGFFLKIASQGQTPSMDCQQHRIPLVPLSECLDGYRAESEEHMVLEIKNHHFDFMGMKSLWCLSNV
jgi:hypothetical protein